MSLHRAQKLIILKTGKHTVNGFILVKYVIKSLSLLLLPGSNIPLDWDLFLQLTVRWQETSLFQHFFSPRHFPSVNLEMWFEKNEQCDFQDVANFVASTNFCHCILRYSQSWEKYTELWSLNLPFSIFCSKLSFPEIKNHEQKIYKNRSKQLGEASGFSKLPKKE